jgi:ankyrin repeat protein
VSLLSSPAVSFSRVVAGETPLFYSAFYGGAAAARYLIDHGADPLAGKIWSPLHAAAAKGLSLSQKVYLESIHHIF